MSLFRSTLRVLHQNNFMKDLLVPRSIVFGEREGERISFRGVDIVFKSPVEAGDGWTVLDYTLPAKQFGAPLHYHRELIESFYVLSGKLWFRLGDQEIEAGPGAFLLVAPGTLHSFANRTETSVRFLAHASSAAHKTFLCELFQMAQSQPIWPPKDPGQIIRLGERYDTVYV